MSVDFKMPVAVVGFKIPMPVVGFKNPFLPVVGFKMPGDNCISFFQILSSKFGFCLTMELVKQKPFFFFPESEKFPVETQFFFFTVAPHFFML